MTDTVANTIAETRTPTEDEVDDLLYNSRAGDLDEFRRVLQAILARQPAHHAVSNKANQDGSGHDDSLDSVLNDVRLANEARNSPLHYASANGHAAIVEELLPRCALSTLLAQNSAGNTPLHWAAFNGHLDVVRSLVDRIEALAQADQRNAIQSTPIAATPKTEQEKDAEAEREAQRRSVWDVVNKAGRGPMSEAQMNNKEDVVEYLLQRMVTAPASSGAETTEAVGEKDEQRTVLVEGAQGDVAVNGTETTKAEEEEDLSRRTDQLRVDNSADTQSVQES